MAGQDPSTMLLPQVLDASVALVAEGYLSLPGMDWWTALEKVQRVGEERPPELPAGDVPVVEKTEEQKVAENNAALASIFGTEGTQSLFKGAK